MLRWVGLPYPTNPHGKSISLSLVGSFGWHEMKEYSRTSPIPNIALSTPQYRRRQNFISSPVPPNDPWSVFLSLFIGKRPPTPILNLTSMKVP